MTTTNELHGLKGWYARRTSDPARRDHLLRWAFGLPIALTLGVLALTHHFRWGMVLVPGGVVLFILLFAGQESLNNLLTSTTWLRRGLTYQKQSTRRRLVVGLYSLWLVAFVGWFVRTALAPALNAQVTNTLLGIAIALYFAGAWGTAVMSRFLHEERMTGPQADERQIAARNQAYRSAYELLASGVNYLWLLVLLGFISHEQLPHLDISDLMLPFLILYSLVPSLPNAMILWQEEDLPNEVE